VPSLAKPQRVLVTASSRYDSTAELADTIARTLEDEGLEVDRMAPEQVEHVEPYDAVVLGSAVYYGRWLDPARELAERAAATLARKPLWLFSSGPVGRPGRELPKENTVDVGSLLASVDVREHCLLPGRLDASRLRLRERALVKAMRAEEGDMRDWGAVRAFARRIAGELERGDGD
jgi:menaquinone-dependent protoporphyrinogen oxidase